LGGFFEIGSKEKKISDLERVASRPDFWQKGENSQNVMAEISALKDTVARWKNLKRDVEDIQAHWELASEAGHDSEIGEIEKSHADLARDLEALDLESKLSGERDRSNAIVSLHAGAGGTEACDWTEMLLRMYRRWADSKRFQTEITDILPGEEAGVKSVTFFVKGPYAYGYLKSEIGVHRLVRISPFDSNKRRHTSFASCDVIPEITEEFKIDINDSDLRVDTYRSSGAGGQHVNKTESAVRITHIPSGIVVACQVERSQIKNRAMAMKLLRARLYEFEQEKKRAAMEKHYDDKGDIAWGNQIRSYVFMPYQLVKDLRTGHETGNVGAVMDGDLDPFIKAYLSFKGKK
jgi:peptide chain release factor 2